MGRAEGGASGGDPRSADRLRRQASRAAFLDELYLILRQREERRRGSDRRLLERGTPQRRGTMGELGVAALARAAAVARDRPCLYLAVVAMVVVLAFAGLAVANHALAPELYSRTHLAAIAEELAAGRGYGVFDLNLDMRELRRQHIRRLAATPEIVLLGASHWQEAHAGLLPGRAVYNAHVHRDHYEDVLAVVEMLVQSDRLPPILVIAIRDMTFQPLAERDHQLWLTALPDYRAMAARLGIPRHGHLETGEWRRLQGLLSLPALLANAGRLLRADRLPGPTREAGLASLDLLAPDGSIAWSAAHRAAFTAERTRREVADAVRARAQKPPVVDPAAVAALERLLDFLRERDVRLVLAHPPFNPAFYGAIAGTPYGRGLRKVEAATRRLAERHGATLAGSFDPAALGCDETMFIDAEHGGPACLGRLLSGIPGL